MENIVNIVLSKFYYRTAIRLRAACMTMLYRKLIRLHSLGDKTVGEVSLKYAKCSFLGVCE